MKTRKRVLIVNCYFDELRIPIRRMTKYPQSMTAAYLAGIFYPGLCEIKLYDEVYSGPLESEALLSWSDMLVLTGLNTAFDRMLHLTAYARTKNRHVIVVAGGPAIRALPVYAKRFFNYCCLGDIEELGEVVEDAFGKDYVSRDFIEKGWVMPRYDLAYGMPTWAGYVESSRNCYFNCNFCSLTAEGVKYQPYDLEYLRQQFIKLGKKRLVCFLDNNFYNSDRQYFSDKMEMIKEFRKKKYFGQWCALVTGDFFLNSENIEMVQNSGCLSLFCGVETFDRQSLIHFKKHQNTKLPQVEIISKCIESGIVFCYGIVLDIANRSIDDLRQELEFIFDTPEITLPSFITLAIPLLKTPFFYECIDNNLFLPNIRLRDMDGTTILLKPHDDMMRVVDFVNDLQTLSIYRKKIINHSRRFFSRYRKTLSLEYMALALYNGLLLTKPSLATTYFGSGKINGLKKQKRTYIGSTEPLDCSYTPAFHVDAIYADYFKPTMLTDKKGNLSAQLYEDVFVNNYEIKINRVGYGK